MLVEMVVMLAEMVKVLAEMVTIFKKRFISWAEMTSRFGSKKSLRPAEMTGRNDRAEMTGPKWPGRNDQYSMVEAPKKSNFLLLLVFILSLVVN